MIPDDLGRQQLSYRGWTWCKICEIPP